MNWTGAPGPSPDNRFYNLDNVTFTDSGVGGTTPVTLTGALAPASVTVNATQNYTFGGSGSITGTCGLTKQGSGTLVLLTDNNYTGGTTITAGTLQLGDGGTIGSITGPITNNAALVVNRSNALTLGGVISGSGTLQVQGGGTLTLSATNSYAGATTVTGGSTLSVGSDANLGTAPGSATPGHLVLNNGTLSASAGFTLNANRGIALGPTSGTGSGTINVASGTLTYNGVIANNGSGTGSLTKTGTGSLTLGGTNTYSGGTTISAGVVNAVLDSATATPLGTGAVTLNGGRLDFRVTDGQIRTVDNNIVLPSTGQQQFIIRAADGSAPGTLGTGARLTGVLSGGAAGQVYRIADSNASGNHNNVLILDNPNNTMQGILEMWRGTLQFTSDGALGNTSNTVRIDTWNLNGRFQFGADNITLNSSRTIQLQTNGVILPIDTQGFTGTIAGLITGAGSLTKLGSGTLIITGNNNYTGTGDGTNSAGTIIRGGTLLANGQTGSPNRDGKQQRAGAE